MLTCPVNATYSFKPHDVVFADQVVQLHRSTLPVDNVTVVDRLFENGLAYRTVVFNDMGESVSEARDLARRRFDIFNSVNKTWAFQVFSGAYRDPCRNTLVFGGLKAYHQKRKHTSGLDTGAMTSKAISGLTFGVTQKTP